MLYTIGHTDNYLKVLKQPETRVFKSVGGYAFLTKEDAQRRIVEEGKTDEWRVFGLRADQNQIKPSADGWWYELIEQAEIILLDD